MKCRNCGADLEDGVLFCRECGSRVATDEVRICIECGATVAADAIFCPDCGTRLDADYSEADEYEPVTYDVELHSEEETDEDHKYSGYVDIGTMTSKASETVRSISTGRSKTKENKKSKSTMLIAIIVVLVVLMLVPKLLSNKSGDAKDSKAMPMAENVLSENRKQIQDFTIEKGSEYAFMSDEWNVYIATAISDSVIQVDRWDKTLSSDRKVEHDEDIGTFKLDDPDIEFYWIDDEHTAFSITFKDEDDTLEGHNMKHRKAVVFTKNISDSDKNKGSDYDKKIACYSYENDDWHLYRAIAMHDNLVKIEVWSRSSSADDYLYGYDLCVINPDNTETDFEWTDDEHTSFTITMRDGLNGHYWKDPEFVAFTLENPKYKYGSVVEFLE